MEAFETLIKEASITVNFAGLKEELDEANPVAPDFIEACQGILTEDVASAEVIQELLGKIPALIEQYPVQGENAKALPAAVTRIEDVKAFRAALRISEAPRPLVDWNDLPTANL